MSNTKSVVHVETADVRVTEWLLPPGSSTTSLRGDCDVVIVPLTKGRIAIRSKGDRRTLSADPGAAIFCSAPIEGSATNEGNSTLAFVEIDLKDSVKRLISA